MYLSLLDVTIQENTLYQPYAEKRRALKQPGHVVSDVDQR